MSKEAKQQVHGSYKTHTPIAGVIQSSILRLFEAILGRFGAGLGGDLGHLEAYQGCGGPLLGLCWPLSVLLVSL